MSGLADDDFLIGTVFGAIGVVGTGVGTAESGSPHGRVNPPPGPASLTAVG